MMRKIKWRNGVGLKILMNIFIWGIIGIITLYGFNYILTVVKPEAARITDRPIEIVEQVGRDIKNQTLSLTKKACHLSEKIPSPVVAIHDYNRMRRREELLKKERQIFHRQIKIIRELQGKNHNSL